MSLMLNIFSKLIDANQREIKRISTRVKDVNSLEPKTKKLTDAQIKLKSDELRKRVQKGESLDSVLPEAFALIREAAFRSIGQRHFDVQFISAVALHEGKISEQKTGEGKTLSATPAL